MSNQGRYEIIDRLAFGLAWTGLILIILLSSTAYGAATNPAMDSQPRRPSIGLVLSGGGARGIAHIGVLKVLEAQRIPIDYIAGTSMGSIVGGAYASGMPLNEMEDFVTKVDWKDVFRDAPERQAQSFRRKQLDREDLFGLELGYRDGEWQLPTGALAGQKLDLVMAQLGQRASGISHFNELPIPFRAVATDLETGEMVVLDQGSLSKAMRASMSVPGAVAPVDYDNRLLVDGGLVRNLPVDIVRQMGAEVVIAVNLGTPLLKRDELDSIFGVASQMIGILTEQNVQESLASLSADDILILPELGDITATSFDRAADAIQVGIVAAEKAIPIIQRYSLSERDYLAHRQGKIRLVARYYRPVDEIRIEQVERVNPRVIEGMLKTKPGKLLDPEIIDKDIARIYGRGDFERVNYRYFQEQGRRVVAIDTFEKSWGPNYLRFGIGFESDFQGTSNFNARTSFDMTWLNALGAAWRNDFQIGQDSFLNTEFFQPLTEDEGLFIAPYLRLESRFEDLFEQDRRVAQYEIKAARVGLDLGNQFSNWGELRLGISGGNVDSSIDTGRNELPALNVFQGALTGRFVADTLDNSGFPKEGNLADLGVFASLDELGSDDNYVKVAGRWNHAISEGPNTFNLGLRGGTSFNGTLPPYDEFILGGFLNLSGYRPGQLRGEDLAFGRLIYYRQIAELPRALGGGLYIGGSLEAGNVWDSFEDADFNSVNTALSVFFGADTILGPFYIGYGHAGSRNNSFYLFIGKP